MKLSGVVNSHGVPLGTTKQGADWAMKALHPAEEGNVGGYPDGSVVSSLCVAYTNQFNIAASGANAWNCDIILNGNPLDCAGVRTVDAVTLAAVSSNMFNHSLETTTGSRLAALTALGNEVEEYRCVAASATIHLNCTALTDSGVVTVSDYPWVPKECCMDVSSATHTVYTNLRLWPDQTKLFETLQTLPHVYTGNARDGVYAPLKITDFDWRETNDFMFHVNAADSDAYVTPHPSMVLLAAGTSVADLPFGLKSTEAGLAGPIYEYPQPKGIAHISFRNLNNAATLTLVCRHVFEMRAPPGTMLAPLMKPSPSFDRVAMDAYRLIARELNDGYPESYNSLGTLVKPIWGIFKSVVPQLIPGSGAVLEQVETAVNAAAPLVKPMVSKVAAAARKAKARRAERKKLQGKKK